MFVLRVIVLFLMCSNLTGQSYTDMTRLKLNLLQNYTKSNRPLRNQSDTLLVEVDIDVRMLKEFNVFEGVLGTHLYITLRWTDEYIRWDSEEYDNITVIKLPLSEVWVPHMVLLNPANNFDFLSSDSLPVVLVRYSSEGLASLQFVSYAESTCTPSVRYFPFDSHTCHVMLSHQGDSTDDVIFVPSHVNKNVDGGDWMAGAVTFTEKWLTPGDNSSQYVDLSIQLSRRSNVLILNLFVPISLLMTMNLLVFFLPTESGEKASFAIILLLSVVFFMTVIVDKLPPVSTDIPNVSVIFYLHLANHTLVCMFTVLSLWVYHRSNTLNIPDCFRCLTVGMNNCQTKRTPPEHTDRTANNAVGSEDGVPRSGTLTWQIVSRAIDFYTLKFCLVFTVIELAFLFTLCYT